MTTNPMEPPDDTTLTIDPTAVLETDRMIVYFENRCYLEYRQWRKVGKDNRVYFENLARFCSLQNIPLSGCDWILAQILAYRYNHSRWRVKPENLLSDKAVERTIKIMQTVKENPIEGIHFIRAKDEIQIFLRKIELVLKKWASNPKFGLLLALKEDYLTPAQFDYGWSKFNLGTDEVYNKIHDRYIPPCIDILKSLLIGDET